MNAVPHHPDDMTNLKKQLSRLEFRRCKKFFEQSNVTDTNVVPIDSATPQKVKSTRGRKPTTTKNNIQHVMNYYSSLKSIPTDALNIIEGIARLDWYSQNSTDSLTQNVVAPHPDIQNYPFVRSWSRVLYISDVNSKMLIYKGFAVNKPNDFGEWFLSPAGETRKQYLRSLVGKGIRVSTLSVSTLVYILKSQSEISATSLQELLNVGKRQAERYNQATRMALPRLESVLQVSLEKQADMLRTKYQRLTDEDYSLAGEENYLQQTFDQLAIDSTGGPLSNCYREDIQGVYVPYVGVVISVGVTPELTYKDAA